MAIPVAFECIGCREAFVTVWAINIRVSCSVMIIEVFFAVANLVTYPTMHSSGLLSNCWTLAFDSVVFVPDHTFR